MRFTRLRFDKRRARFLQITCLLPVTNISLSDIDPTYLAIHRVAQLFNFHFTL